MTISRISVLFLLCSFLSVHTFAQSKIAISDQIKILDDETDSLLAARLNKNSIIYDNMIDYSNKCTHSYAEIYFKSGLVYIEIKDCHDEVLGIECLGSKVESMSSDLKAFLLWFYIREIIRDKDKEKEDITKFVKNEHDSRYFFSPSSYNLKKGELYYNTIYFLLHDIQYGLTDNFSIGMGTSIVGMPIYFTPKFSFRINEKNGFALGDMFMVGTYGMNFYANLAYATYTYGSSEQNLTLGVGYFSTVENDVFDEKINQPLFNLSALVQFSNYVYFTTENYYMHKNTTLTAHHYNQSTTIWEHEDYIVSDNFVFGFSGFRIINKSRDVISWQFGLAYYIRFMDDMPYKYTSNDWDGDYPGNSSFPIPTVSYTQKFGKKY